MKKKSTARDCKVTITVEIHLDVAENADLDEVISDVERNTDRALEAAYDAIPNTKLTQDSYINVDLLVKKTKAAKKAAKKKGKKK